MKQAPHNVVLAFVLTITMKNTLTFCYVFLVCSLVYAQSEEDKFQFSAIGGITFRTTIMQNFNFQQPFGRTIYWHDYSYEKNIQGLSYEAGLKLKIPNPKLEITYRLGIRYDHTNNLLLRWTNDTEEKKAICPACTLDITNDPEFEIAITEYQKSWLFDHHIMLMKSFKNRKHSIGIGLTIVNANGHYVDYYGNKKKIEFMNYDLIYQRKIWKSLIAQANIIYIPKGQYPPDSGQDFLSYSIGLFYELNFSKSP